MAIALGNVVKASFGTLFQTPPIALAAPAGLGTSLLDLIIGAITDNASGVHFDVPSDGTAYTSVVNANLVTSGSARGEAIIMKKVGAASPGSVNLSWSGGYNDQNAVACRSAWSGVDLTTPIDAQSASVTRGQTTGVVATPTMSVPAITTVTDGAVAIAWVAAAAQGNADPNAFAAVAGWTRLLAGAGEGGSPRIALGLYYKTVATAGTTGTCDMVFQNIASDPDIPWAGGMIALRPAAGGGGGGPTLRGVRANFLGL